MHILYLHGSTYIVVHPVLARCVLSSPFPFLFRFVFFLQKKNHIRLSTMSRTIVQTATTTGDSFKEAVPDRHTQPGLEAVFLQGPGFGYPAQNGYGQGHGHGHGHTGPPVQQGIGKKKFFILWVALGVLVAAVIGLSVGLGVGLTKKGGMFLF